MLGRIHRRVVPRPDSLHVEVRMSPIAATEPVAEELAAELISDDDELLVEEISIDGMCGVY